MDCLNGRRRATGGRVLANGEDFYHHFDTFRQSLGYVPQRDIVHTQLTVSRAFYYTARLRLPTDTGPAELTARIEEVLELMELGPHRDTLVANLSGGQIKRVSLGAELLARPCLLYIDEATSGLDAGTEARMMRLFRQLADESKSILCITHNVDNVDRCHVVLVLLRGKLVYYGPPREAPPYFGVTKLSEIYDRLAEREATTWEKMFEASSLHRLFVADRLDSSPREPPPIRTPPAGLVPVRPRSEGGSASFILAPGRGPTPLQRLPLWHQFRVLSARYAELTLGDRRSFRLLLLQAPIVALFLLAGFVGKPYEKKIPVPRELNENEVIIVQVVDGLDRALTSHEALDPAQEQRLAATQFTIQEQGISRTVNGAQLVRLLQLLLRTDSQALERIHITVQGGEQRITRSARQLMQLRETLHEAHLTDRLLQAHADHLPVVPDRDMIDPRYTYMLLFMLVIIVLWFGCNNAAKEIVKEEAIYGRERAVNLGILPYLASKFLVLSLITVGQALLLMVVVYGTLEVLHQQPFGHEAPPAAYQLGYAAQLGVLSLLAMTGVALGLLLSACVSSPERASALLPYVLIPQIILGGGILPIKGGLLWLFAIALSPVYWAFRAVHRGASLLPEFIAYHQDYQDSTGLPCGVLAAELVVLLGATAWFLRRKDVNRV
jgi:ABC-type multidrug transport system ATPase subunit